MDVIILEDHNCDMCRIIDFKFFCERYKKMKIKKTEFTCDQCNKKKEWINGYPYKQGWCYIYKLSMKKTTNIDIKDKHFCCKACMEKYIKNILSEFT